MKTLRAEGIKARGWRPVWIMVACMLALGLAWNIIITTLGAGPPERHIQATWSDYVSIFFFVPLLAMMIPAFLFSTEFTHGSIPVLYVKNPRRLPVIFAKLFWGTLTAVMTSLGVVALGVIVALISGPHHKLYNPLVYESWKNKPVATIQELLSQASAWPANMIAHGFLYAAVTCLLCGLIGMGAALIFRNTTAVFGVLIGFYVVADRLLGLWEPWSHVSLSTAINDLTHPGLAQWSSFGTVAGWAIILLVIGLVLEKRRDVSL